MDREVGEAASDALHLEGVVTEHHRGDIYEIACTVGAPSQRVMARRSGRLIKNFIRLIPGDRVVVELSPYDTSRGRVVRRLDPGRRP